jgi:hypothetical protein
MASCAIVHIKPTERYPHETILIEVVLGEERITIQETVGQPLPAHIKALAEQIIAEIQALEEK